MYSISDLLSKIPGDIQAHLALSGWTVPTSRAESKHGPLRLRKINDHVHEIWSPLCMPVPPVPPLVELVFFHGLQLKGSHESEGHLDTWISKDGSELWLNWILEKFPGARILVISYDAHAKKNEVHGRMDMYLTTENLLQCLTGGAAEVGQNKCPVILVGHCIGGLVMKQLCVFATNKVAITPEERTQPVQKFLDNLKGLFFYATPHHGTRLAESSTILEQGVLFEESAPLNTDSARRNENFRILRDKKGWRTFGIGETNEVTLGSFRGLIVQEASARCDVDGFFTALNTDHFNVSRPESTTSSNYSLLIQFIGVVMKEFKAQIHDKEPVHLCTRLPAHAVGLTTRAQHAQDMLKGGAVLGIFGMGGIGKSTLVRQVFNNISKQFEYTCFVDTVKGLNINDLEKVVLERFYHKGMKLDGTKTQWSQMKGKKALIVMDDADSVDQLGVLPPWQHFGDGSCLIVTSRNQGVFKVFDNCITRELDFLNMTEATNLFCKHAFGSEQIPPGKSEQLITSVVKKCSGLPLSLEVMGRYLRNETSDAVWKETIDNLENGVSIDGSQNADDRLWNTLEVSYKKLSNEAQGMFLDVATASFDASLETVFVAWSDRKAETTWKNLVDRAMVKEVTTLTRKYDPYRQVQHKVVWVHEQLRDLAKKLAKDTMLHGTTYEEQKSIVDKLNANLVNADTRGLRLLYDGRTMEAQGPPSVTLRMDALLRLEQLRSVQIDCVSLECERSGVAGTLRHLAVLQLSNCTIPWDFPGTLGKLVNLRILTLRWCNVPRGFLEALGNLKNLHVLSLLTNLLEEPASFGEVTSVKDLTITSYDLRTLPDSFAALKSVQKVTIDCTVLECLPNEFDKLVALTDLTISSRELKMLPDSFGCLKAIRTLTLNCPWLKSLPEGFGRLSTLVQLTIVECPSLDGLPGDFVQLETLKELNIVYNFNLMPPEVRSRTGLRRLPFGFERLSSLETLRLSSPGLEILGDDFHRLANLSKLIVKSIALETLPDNFGHLKSLRFLRLECPGLKKLPDGFGRLSSLETLTLRCVRLKSLADDFGQLANLKDLTIESNDLETLPDSFGNLQTIRSLEWECPAVKTLSDVVGRLSSLETLTLCKEERNDVQFHQLANLKGFTIKWRACKFDGFYHFTRERRAKGRRDLVKWL